VLTVGLAGIRAKQNYRRSRKFTWLPRRMAVHASLHPDDSLAICHPIKARSRGSRERRAYDVCTASTSNSCFGRKINLLNWPSMGRGPKPQPVEIVGPRLHHLPPIRHARRAVVGRPHFVSLRVCEFQLDHVRWKALGLSTTLGPWTLKENC
jgi:hypothetical protein